MERVLMGLKPERVFYHFESLSQIPRGSGNEKAVSDYLVKFAKGIGLEVIQEPCNNIIIKKPATRGYEDSKSVILQGHMDMVCVKEEGLDFDFEKDPIPVYVDGDSLRARGTTLGADNGIAVAMMMAIMEDNDTGHPALTGLVTVDEETGMGGVLNLDGKNIDGDILINIDSEEEGVVLASCAGGARNKLTLPIKRKVADKEMTYVKVDVHKLLGGHSGIEINKHRGNAIKLLGRVLESIGETAQYDLVHVEGGDKMNAIPNKAFAIIASHEIEKVKEIILELDRVFKNELEIPDPDIEVAIEETDPLETVLDEQSKVNIVTVLRMMPNGVQTMSAGIEGLVESSTNVGVLSIEGDNVNFESAIRSSVASLKFEINDRIKCLATLVGGESGISSQYPAWAYKSQSYIRDLMSGTYKEMYGKELEVDAIHAGLECGFLTEKVGDIDMISLGPNMSEVHSPQENLSISSVERVYSFLVEVLKRIEE